MNNLGKTEVGASSAIAQYVRGGGTKKGLADLRAKTTAAEAMGMDETLFAQTFAPTKSKIGEEAFKKVEQQIINKYTSEKQYDVSTRKEQELQQKIDTEEKNRQAQAEAQAEKDLKVRKALISSRSGTFSAAQGAENYKSLLRNARRYSRASVRT